MSKPTRSGAGGEAVEASRLNLDKNNARSGFDCFRIEKRRCWGPISVNIVDRAAGEAICRTDYYRLTYYLTDFQATIEDDESPQWKCQLSRGNFVFRPPGTTLRCDVTAGRYIQILQSRDTYEHLLPEMLKGDIVDLGPVYNIHDPLISQLVLTISNEIESGFLDRILVDALNTALAVQITRLCSGPTAIFLEPSNGLSRERLKRVYDYVEAHLGDRLTLVDLASVACLSPSHFMV